MPKGFKGRWAFLVEMAVLLVLSGGLAVLANAAHPQGLSWKPAPVDEALEDGSVLTADQARELLETGHALFLDARHPEDYAQGHIPGALSVPPGMFAEDVQAMLAEAGKGKVLVAYCSNVQCPLAHRLAEGLDMIGVEGVRVFEGGMQEWTQAGGPVERAEASGPAARGEAGS